MKKNLLLKTKNRSFTQKFCCFWVTLILLVCSTTIYAHQPSESFLTYKNDAWQWEVAVLDIYIALQQSGVNLDANADRTITWQELINQRTALITLVQQSMQMTLDETDCSAYLNNIKLKDRSDGTYAVLYFTIHNSSQGQTALDSAAQNKLCNGKKNLAINNQFLAKTNSHHQTIFAYKDEPEFISVLSPGTTQNFALQSPSFFNGLSEFFIKGTLHIWEGYDHLLFLLALLLPAALLHKRNRSSAARSATARPSTQGAHDKPSTKAALKELFKIVTAFTIAHSITLTLAAFGVLALPSQPVEILIALSIVLVAALNIILVRQHHRWPIAFLFGLLHGFGFANNLLINELDGPLLISSLLGFNLGVEFGQLVVVAALVPILLFIAKGMPQFYRWFILRLGSLAIIGISVLWVIERI